MSKKLNQIWPKRELVNQNVGLTKLYNINSTEKQKDKKNRKDRLINMKNKMIKSNIYLRRIPEKLKIPRIQRIWEKQYLEK